MNEHRPPLPPDEPVSDVNGSEVNATPSKPPPKPAPPLPSDAPPPPPEAPPRPTTYAPRDPMAKAPGLALFLSIFFPGLGHIYVASYERAMMIIAGIGVSIWGIVASDGRLWLLAFAITFGYFFSIFDAYREAQIANLETGEELPARSGSGEGRLMFGIFLVVVAGLVMADNLGFFDLRWIYDWWPALVLLVGVYFIGSWIWERVKTNRTDRDDLD